MKTKPNPILSSSTKDDTNDATDIATRHVVHDDIWCSIRDATLEIADIITVSITDTTNRRATYQATQEIE